MRATRIGSGGGRLDTTTLIIAGLVLLGLGGELVVRGGVGVARALRVSPLIIGVVLMGFGTSLPELVTSLRAAMAGSPGVAVGNVVGSNIANLLLIAGVAAALTGAAASRKMIWRDGLAMLLSSAALVWLLYQNGLDRIAGVALLGALVVYLVIAVATERRGGSAAEMDDGAALKGGALVGLLVFAVGVAATVLGAGWLVDGAIALAREFGATETLIGVTIVAIGTSLPELAAAVAAAIRRQPEMAVGNVLGSNVFNVCAIVGVTAVVTDVPTPPEILTFDVWAMLAASVLMLVLAGSWRRLSRGEGLILLLCYLAFLGTTVSMAF